ncbi:MAG: enoyl-CoA hydratase-related protein [Cyclobacteriaceae bacterium]|jgi:enoyl-CoA hydratase|nr:enoyl-CoA hydratase-related protein [Cyclobacteriaceae bacterium]
MSVLFQPLNNLGLITISRPEALNALNTNILKELENLFESLRENSAIRGVLITGEGEKSFVAGADIKELSTLKPEEATALSAQGHRIFHAIEHFTKPVIAVVNGFALGGGCELAMACHIRIATANAKFGLPEVNLGLIPGYGGTQRLAQLVGRAKAFELAMTAQMVTATEAKELGLANHVCENKIAALELATSLLNKAAEKGPLAIEKLIQAINAGYHAERYGYETEAKLFGELFATEDFKEGTSAFINKAKPNFKGK